MKFSSLSKKHLISALVVLAVLVVVYVIVKVAVLNPAADMDSDIRRLKKENSRLKRYNDQQSEYRNKLKDYARQTFGLDPIEVSELIRVRIDKMVSASGMQRGKNVSTPISGKTKPGVYEEVGWSYDLIGSLQQVVSMMYLIKADPYLHRIEGLSVVPNRKGTEYKLSFRYVTIVLLPEKNETLPVGLDDGEQRPIPDLDAKPRQWYQRIAMRNVFRPYVPKPKPKPKPQPKPSPKKPPKPKPNPGIDYSRFKLTNLSLWGREVVITVHDSKTDQSKQYRPGDQLAGGTIVMVDYRSLSRPDKPQVVSTSRLVLRIDGAFYAVELGQTLADRYRLTGESLPPALRQSGLRENLRAPAG